MVRIRLDTAIERNILDVMDNFAGGVEIWTDWDFFAIGTPAIMDCYCTGLESKYGQYGYESTGEIPNVMKDYDAAPRERWWLAPERQLFAMLFEYCTLRRLKINDTIGVIPGPMARIVRLP